MLLHTSADIIDVTASLAITYSSSIITGEWSSVTGVTTTTYYTALSYTRTATMTFSILGLTQSAAETIADTIRGKYQRSRRHSDWNPNTGEFVATNQGEIACMAEVSIRHTAGAMYSVEVEVRETDTLLHRVPISPETLFATENTRSYPTS